MSSPWEIVHAAQYYLSLAKATTAFWEMILNRTRMGLIRD